MDQYSFARKAAFQKKSNEKVENIVCEAVAKPKTTLENVVLLPTDGLKEYGPEGRYAALGIQILEVDERDPMFTQAILPEGWKVTYSDHSMYKHIVDTKGRMRTRYFYKQAFYDRSASMWGPERRYTTQIGNHPSDSTYYEYLVIDRTKAKWGRDGKVCSEAILYSSKVDYVGDDVNRFKAAEEAEQNANNWLAENYPDAKNFMAYWD